MNRFLIKQTALLSGLLLLVSCSTFNHLDKHATAAGQAADSSSPSTKKPEPAAENPKAGSSQADSESFKPTPHDRAVNIPRVPLASPENANDNSSDTNPDDSDSSASLTPDELAALNLSSGPNDDSSAEPDSADQDTGDTDSAGDAANDTGSDSSGDTEEEITYDVPIVLNESVEAYIEYFQTEIRDKFKLWLERSGRYIPTMRQIFREEGLPEDLVFVSLIESGFNPYAYSRSRAVGHWQFIKGTGRLYGLQINSWIDERRDPIKSTRAAARYLKDLYNRFGSWPLAMAGYNAGERKISRALVKAKADDFWDLRSTRYIRRETKGYVPKFMAATIIAKNPERYGFTLDYHEPLQFDTVTVPGSADLRVVAQAAGVTYQEIKELNSELRTVLTPPYMEEYTVRLPVGTKQTFIEAYSQIPEEKRVIGTRYKVRRHDTLAKIARQYGTTVSLLRETNHLERGHILHVDDDIFIPKIGNVPRERERRMVASRSRPRVQKKKEPIKMASLETETKTDTSEDGTKILYLVKDGDTLWDISKSFNVSIHDLKRYNGLGKRSMIRPGDQLVLGFQSKDL
jgi:peptidoglycan lytic transglycosylase D